MPPGPNKRKSSKKKKKKAKPSKSSGSTPVDGESDDGEISSSASNSQHNSPLPPVKPETMEDKSPAKKSSTVETPEKEEGKIEIDRKPGSQEKSSIHRNGSSDNKSRDRKKAVVIQPAQIDSPTKKLQQKKDPLTPLKHTVINESNHLKETGLGELVEKLVSVEETSTPKSKNCSTASTLNCPFCGRGDSADLVKEHEMPECPEKHPLIYSNPGAAEKSSWKSCCGLLELCSGSSR